MNQYDLVAGLEEFSKVINEYLFQFQEILNSDVMKGVELRDSKDNISALNKIMKNVEAQIKTADRKFTLAIFGEFKAGKSTLINALLGLSDDARLSTEDSPDTACSTLLRHKSESDAEAKIIMNDGSSNAVSWEEAKGISSQVYRDKNPNKFQYDKIVEIEYYVDSDLLRTISLNDLPGTGSRYYDTHTEAARTKMREADAVIWVTPGNKEPDAATREELYRLQEVGRRVIPIVNIIEDLGRGLRRNPNTINAISRVLDEDWSEFYATGIEKPVYVSAKMLNIELSKDVPNTELLAQYGYYDLLNVIDNIKLTAQGKGNEARIKRLRGVGLNIFSETRGIVSNIISDVETQYTKHKRTDDEFGNQREEMDYIISVLRYKIKDIAEDKANEVCEIILDSGKDFIDQTMQLRNIKAFFKAWFQQNLFEQELEKSFTENYFDPNDDFNPLNKLLKKYIEQIKETVANGWQKFYNKPLHEFIVAEELKETTMQWNELVIYLSMALFDSVIDLINIVAMVIKSIEEENISPVLQTIRTLVSQDPLEQYRNEAKENLASAVEAKLLGIESELFAMGIKGADKIATKIEEVLGSKKNDNQNIINNISKLLEASKNPIEIIDKIHDVWNR